MSKSLHASTNGNETFTPGPWDHRQRYNALQDEIGIDGQALVTVWVRKHKAQKDDTNDRIEPWPAGEANARLIAAAPELLEALVKLHAHWDLEEPIKARCALTFDDPSGINKAMQMALAAMRKALGESDIPDSKERQDG